MNFTMGAYQFDINKIIEHFGLNTEDLAKVLFPNVKYPKQAFSRVLKNEVNLDVKQVERLAAYAGVLVADLFSPNTWHGFSESGCIVMQKGEYKVKLSYGGVYISIYKDGTLINRIADAPSMSMREFMDFLDNTIKDYQNGSN